MITARNTNHMMPHAYDYIFTHGVKEDTRNGPVLSVPHPVILCYTQPLECVNFCPVRDANPFFHFMEMLWFLEGEGDVKLITKFLPRMAEYSDDGITFNAHYGYNVRRLFDDQLLKVIDVLRKFPDSRQAVVQIWNPADLGKVSKDLACNMQLVFRVIDDTLCMTVYNRSNDAVWGGVSGANITNLGIFQQYVAAGVELPMGKQWIVSNNLHVYLNNPQTRKLYEKYYNPSPYLNSTCPYSRGEVNPKPLLNSDESLKCLDRDIRILLDRIRENRLLPDAYCTEIIKDTAVPLVCAHRAYKSKNMNLAVAMAKSIEATDWRLACVNWLTRRA